MSTEHSTNPLSVYLNPEVITFSNCEAAVDN